LPVIEKQVTPSIKVLLSLLNSDAAWGGKHNSAGNPSYRKGCKLYLNIIDYCIPVTASSKMFLTFTVDGTSIHFC
jgi:hypothetical protein